MWYNLKVNSLTKPTTDLVDLLVWSIRKSTDVKRQELYKTEKFRDNAPQIVQRMLETQTRRMESPGIQDILLAILFIDGQYDEFDTERLSVNSRVRRMAMSPFMISRLFEKAPQHRVLGLVKTSINHTFIENVANLCGIPNDKLSDSDIKYFQNRSSILTRFLEERVLFSALIANPLTPGFLLEKIYNQWVILDAGSKLIDTPNFLCELLENPNTPAALIEEIDYKENSWAIPSILRSSLISNKLKAFILRPNYDETFEPYFIKQCFEELTVLLAEDAKEVLGIDIEGIPSTWLAETLSDYPSLEGYQYLLPHYARRVSEHYSDPLRFEVGR